jgi:cellulose synthase/poly-beta-1,6-N-acetylglucosamine synthase-like glycosyltransferase
LRVSPTLLAERPTLEEVTTLSVVIPATDGPMTLRLVTEAIERSVNPPEELIVIDSPQNLGPAAARNVGARQARGDVLVFVDADVEVHCDALTRIRSAFDGDPTLAAIFGSYDDNPGRGGVVSDFRNLLHHYVHQQGAGVATTFWAGLGAMRRDAFFELGGFDEERFPRASVEDIELGMRLHARGAGILLDPRIRGKHLKTWTLWTMTKTDLLRRGVPWLRLVLEKRSGSRALNLGWSHRIGTAASLLLVGALVRGRSSLAGGALALLIFVDRQFYGLLLRRRGPMFLVAAFPLHIVHRLTSAFAVPIALTVHVRAEVRALRARRPVRHGGAGRPIQT